VQKTCSSSILLVFSQSCRLATEYEGNKKKLVVLLRFSYAQNAQSWVHFDVLDQKFAQELSKEISSVQ
jgi:hypothetical protein